MPMAAVLMFVRSPGSAATGGGGGAGFINYRTSF